MTQTKIDNHHRPIFKFPGRVNERKHFIADELTELTGVHNEMTDELAKQYTSLDEKVAERSRELLRWQEEMGWLTTRPPRSALKRMSESAPQRRRRRRLD